MNEKLEKLVARLDRKLLENHRGDRQLFAELIALQKRTGIMHDDRPICPFLRPYFFPRSLYERIGRAAGLLHRAHERLTEAALADKDLLAELGLTEREERLARIDPRYGGLCVSSRFDAFLSGTEFKFLEYNAETPAGVGDQLSLLEIFERIPEVGEFLASRKHFCPQPHAQLLKALDAAYRDFGGRKDKPQIAIVDWQDVSTRSEFYILRDYFETKGYRTLIADPFELEYDGDFLRVGDFEIDIFYKRVIIHEFLDRFDETAPLVRAYLDGKVCMANSFRSKIPHKKANFAILSDEKYEWIFTAGQTETIRRHIPWTRRVRETRTVFAGREVELMELLRQRREKFILKPNDDYGGHGITLGRETTAAEWDAALEFAAEHFFVAQECVEVEKTSIPTFGEELSMQSLNVDFDPFLFRGRVAGGLVRLSAQSLVNVSQGGGETALVILEDF